MRYGFPVLLALSFLPTLPAVGGVAENDWRLAVKPDAIADLRTREGASAVGATWRFRAAEIVEVDHRAPGRDLKASGVPIRTHDL
jgi:hypothetical protein